MKLTIYMKSGNQIVLPFVKSWKFDSNGNEVVGMRIERRFFHFGPRLIVPTIDLSQIEAVTVG